MKEKERLDKIAELKSEMRNMLDKAKTEKRNLTEDEQKTFDDLNGEVRMHTNFFNANDMTPESKQEDVDIRSIFAKNLAEAIEGGNKSARIEVRANIPINNADIVDTIPVLYKDVLKALEPRLILDKVGIKMQTGVRGVPTWPTVGNVEAQILGENAELNDKSIDFSKITATPKRAGVTIRLSRRAINQSNLNLYDIVVNQIAESIAMLLNKWLVKPEAIATGCEGVFVKNAAQVIPLSKQPFLVDVVGLETTVLNSNVNGTNGAYVLGTAMRGRLKTKPIEAGNPAMILTGNEMNGYPVVTSNLIPADYIGFGFFEYAVLSQFGDFSLVVDPYTLATKNEIRFTGNSEFDITVLRPEAFALGKVETAKKLYVDVATPLKLAATKAEGTATKQIVLKGINLTADITAVLSTAQYAKYAVSAASFVIDANGKVDSILTVTYTPTANTVTGSEDKAILTLASTGATSIVIALEGTSTGW